MVPAEFSDSTLVLIGHGSTVSAESAAPVYQHAADLRGRGLFAEVREAFWKQRPRLLDVMSGLATPRVFLAPMFISAGYFSEVVIPRALGFREEHATTWNRVQHRAQQRLFYGHPIGTHPGMTQVLLSRAGDIIQRRPPVQPLDSSQTTLLIVGHGTEENENSRKSIEQQVELIRAQQRYGSVRSAFLEEEPRIADWPKLALTSNIIVVPFFISDGMHTRRDIPILLGEPEAMVNERFQAGQPTWHNPTERNGKLIWYTSSIGSEPHVAEVILERVREASQW